jgi:hypothetical protein
MKLSGRHRKSEDELIYYCLDRLNVIIFGGALFSEKIHLLFKQLICSGWFGV